ncbi:MAG: hypothetical protein ACJA0N_002153 [Pseudohongiellaceae bacterium]|jgi:hypothetical protein
MGAAMLPDIDFSEGVYTHNAQQKSDFLSPHLLALTTHHYQHCSAYKNYIDGVVGGIHQVEALANIPPLAAALFKSNRLVSVEEKAVFKTLRSSGTSGTALSTIILDQQTAQLQTKALGKILQTIIGKQRLPLLLVDHNSLLADSADFSARGAGVQGLAMFGRDQTYLLDQTMLLNVEALDQFYQQYKNKPVLMFGFTFMVWQHLLDVLKTNDKHYNFSQLTLLHSGGWKKLNDKAVSNRKFEQLAKASLGANTQIHNFYGMVEQTGSIYIACEHGHLHVPIYADIRIRHPQTFELVNHGEQGLIETLSILPRSYPGHAILTQDIGRIDGEDSCSCGRLGKTFTVLGRQQKAVVRGCSDSYA